MTSKIKNAQDAVVTGQQSQAITLLLAGKTQVDVALEVGVACETVNRWLHGDAVFVAAYNAARLELWLANSARLRDLSTTAIDTIATILNDPNEASAIRLRAAVMVLKDLGMGDKPGGGVTVGEVEIEWHNEQMLSVMSQL